MSRLRLYELVPPLDPDLPTLPNLLAQGSGSSTLDSGTRSSADDRLEYSFREAGRYYIEVTAALPAGDGVPWAGSIFALRNQPKPDDLATGSAATFVVALARSTNPRAYGCVDAECAASLESRFRAFCDFDANASTCGGLGATRIAPLGLSLMLTGASWFFGQELIEEPWLIVVGGIALGVLTYGTAVIVE